MSKNVNNDVIMNPPIPVFHTCTTGYKVTYQTRETVFHRDIQTPRGYDAQRSIFDEIRGVWIADETLSQVFDISSQSKYKIGSTQRSKLIRIRC